MAGARAEAEAGEIEGGSGVRERRGRAPRRTAGIEIEAVGATPYVPFKTNSRDKGSPAWRRMWGMFLYRQDEFLAHYHKRSNVETTFSMVKAKFRDHVRSKTDVAMKNEVLCKIICHNICCLIQESHELGIDTAFWANTKH